MAFVEIDFKPDRRKLRQFGLFAFVAFGLLGGLVLWLGGLPAIEFGSAAPTVAYVLFGLGVLAGVLALAHPPANRILFVGLAVVTFPIGFVVSYLMMGFIFYGLFTPIALFFRLIGRDILHREFEPGAKSYWVDRKPATGDTGRYFKQF